MIVSVAAVISVDARMTRGSEPDVSQWASPEDQAHFHSLINNHEVVVMGSGTYNAYRHSMKLTSNHLRIVLTSRPKEFKGQEVSGQLEFYDLTPKELVNRLEKENKKNLLVTGGGQMITDFLEAQLVDNLYLTVEPYVFGQGKPLTKDIILNTALELVSSQTLNKKGTTLLTYKVR